MRVVTLESTQLATPHGCRLIFGKGVVLEIGVQRKVLVDPEQTFPDMSFDLKVQEVIVKKLAQNSLPDGRLLRALSNGLVLVTWSFGKQLKGDGKVCRINISPFLNWR